MMAEWACRLVFPQEIGGRPLAGLIVTMIAIACTAKLLNGDFKYTDGQLLDPSWARNIRPEARQVIQFVGSTQLAG